MVKIAQYPRNADGTPMNLDAAVLVDATGNGGARLTNVPIGPDGAPIDTYGIVLVDMAGNPVSIGSGGGSSIYVNAKDHGVVGNANSTGSTGTDDTAALQAAINYTAALVAAFPSASGGTLLLDSGNFKVSSYLTIPPNVVLKGAGRKSTKIIGTHAGGGGANTAENIRNGSILYNGNTVNTSTRIDIAVEGLWLANSNVANQGAGFFNQAGTVFSFRDCEIGSGCKYGVVIDQSEDVLFDNCELISNVAGGAAVFITNGAEVTPGAAGGYSNIVNFRDCDINVSPGCYGILDNGGAEHTFSNCNLNGGINGVRVCNVNGLLLSNCYAESQSGEIIHLDSKTLDGTSKGGSLATIVGGQWSVSATNRAIVGANAPGSLVVVGGSWSPSGILVPLTGGATFYSLSIINPGLAGYPATMEFCDAPAAGTHFESAKLPMTLAGLVPTFSAVNINGASGAFRPINFQTVGVTNSNIGLGSDNASLFYSTPSGSHTFNIGGTAYGAISANGFQVLNGSYYSNDGSVLINGANKNAFFGNGTFSGTLVAGNLAGVNTGDQDLSGLQTKAPVTQTVASAATVTPAFGNDQVNITAQAAALILANWSGTAIPAFGLVVRIKDNGTARAITYGTKYRAMSTPLPTTTVANKTMYLGFIYNSTDDKFDFVSLTQEP